MNDEPCPTKKEHNVTEQYKWTEEKIREEAEDLMIRTEDLMVRLAEKVGVTHRELQILASCGDEETTVYLLSELAALSPAEGAALSQKS